MLELLLKSWANLKSILCLNKWKLLLNSYIGVDGLESSWWSKNKNITRAIELISKLIGGDSHRNVKKLSNKLS